MISDSEGLLENEANVEIDGANVNETEVDVEEEPGEECTDTEDGELEWILYREFGREDGTKSPALGLRKPVDEETTDSGGEGGARGGGIGVEREECGEPDMMESGRINIKWKETRKNVDNVGS